MALGSYEVVFLKGLWKHKYGRNNLNLGSIFFLCRSLARCMEWTTCSVHFGIGRHWQVGDETQKTTCHLNKTFNATTGEWCHPIQTFSSICLTIPLNCLWCPRCNLHSNPTPYNSFFCSCFLRIAVLKSVISFVSNKKQVCVKPAAREGGEAEKRGGGGGGWQWWGGRVRFSHPFHPKKKKKEKEKPEDKSPK